MLCTITVLGETLGLYVEQVRLLVDEDGTHSHGNLQLEFFQRGGLQAQSYGIVLDARLCLLADTVAFGNHVHKLTSHGDFLLGSLGKAHTDGVADALGKQGADAHGTLDASVLALACLGNTKVQGEGHALPVHLLYQQAHALHHHHGVAGLDGDDHVHEIVSHTDAQELHATLHDALGSVAIARHDAVGERTVVHTYAHRRTVLAANLEEGKQACLYLLQFLGILLVGVLQLLELTCGIHIVAGVDTNLLAIVCRYIGNIRVEVNVSHQRHGTACPAHRPADKFHVLCLACALGGKAHQLATCLGNAQNLCHAGFGVHGAGVGHRLNPDGVFAAQTDVAHGDFVGLATCVCHS